jgi:EAL domain-containing protein (putative c-di-GMP-specific phosphodiesterase class I)
MSLQIKQAVAIDAYAAEGLELEITESMLMQDIQHNITSLKAIRAMGITWLSMTSVLVSPRLATCLSSPWTR